MPAMAPLADRFGRQIKTLRISLTDRCNFRCVYCMPPDGMEYMPKSDWLTIDELVRFVRAMGMLGVSRYRLTGGEPLLRKDIVDIVRSLRGLDTVRELSITTNASRLTELAAPLKSAGLDRFNISLDSLDAERFGDVTLYRDYARVRAGIDAALREGFPVKINVVVLSGMPDGEIIEFVAMAVEHSLEVRFLEFMPLCGTGWSPDLVYPIGKVRELVARHFDIVALPRADEPAESWSIVGGAGRVGFIAPLSEPFCERCSRIRISADGKLRPCLFSQYETDLSPLLKENAADEELIEAIRRTVWNKPHGSQFADEPFDSAGDHAAVQSGPLIRSIGG